MPNIDRPALRYAVRSGTSWFVLLVGVGYGYISTLADDLGLMVWAAMFTTLAGIAFVWRYHDHIDRREWAAERAAHLAERTAQSMRAVALGTQCPDDCEECADEARRNTELVEQIRRERAARHGHALMPEQQPQG